MTLRLAIIVSHPIQYYAPLYQKLASQNQLAIKVFFTWHAGETAIKDQGFGTTVAWDIPLTEGYDFEQVPNLSSDPGTHHFFGLRNPSLVERVKAWKPDLVQINGWAWVSHLRAMRAFRSKRIPVLFRGDSHLLDGNLQGARWHIKRAVLKRVYSWPSGFAVVGTANRSYYETFGVESRRIFPCRHSIDVRRFAEPGEKYEQEAVQWRHSLGISDEKIALLFAGKFERKKQPLELMRVVQAMQDPRLVLIMVGSGELSGEVNAFAAADTERFRVLPFQNQSRMPVVYRLGDLFILPSAFGETWGLAVNEALASSRPVLVSDRVGCALDVVDRSCGRVYSCVDRSALGSVLSSLTADRTALVRMRQAAVKRSWLFDIARTEAELIAILGHVLHSPVRPPKSPKQGKREREPDRNAVA